MRYTLGPAFAATAPTRPPAVPVAPQGDAAVPTKADVAVVLGKIDEVAWTIEVQIPAYDLATSNKLIEVRAYLLPAGFDGLVPPTTGQAWVDSSFAFSVENVADYQGGANASFSLPDVPPAKHLGQIVLGFDA